MWEWINRLFGRANNILELKRENDRRIELESRIAELEMEKSENEKTIATLKQDLERERTSENDRMNEMSKHIMEQILSEASAPASQLYTQAYLLDAGIGTVRAGDVLAVAMRLVRILEDAGMSQVGLVGEQICFNPNFHQPLSGETDFETNTPVVIRFVGFSCDGKVILKAGVERGGD